jgi:hypothetical protein
MKKRYSLLISLLLITAVTLPVQITAQVKGKTTDYQPVVGQGGKDVVWVPTPQELVDAMLDLAKVTPKDFLVDLGSGDGRTVITAAKRGVRAIGLEYNPDMVGLSKANAAKEGVSDKAQFVVTDIFEYDFSEATVVTMFLLSDLNLRLRPQLLEMKPGTRLVSNTFTMGEWVADDKVVLEDEDISWNTAYLWIVPAKAEGKWKLDSGAELVILQRFQRIIGGLKYPGTNEISIEGIINGYEITFTAGDKTYKGTISGNNMSGTASNGKTTTRWSASK